MAGTPKKPESPRMAMFLNVLALFSLALPWLIARVLRWSVKDQDLR